MAKSKALCKGCYNNDYNHGLGGAKECWNYEDGIVKLRKRVHINDRPPWRNDPRMMMSCYQEPKYIFVNGDRER